MSNQGGEATPDPVYGPTLNIVKIQFQLNSTQSNSNLGLRLDIAVTWNPPSTNFSDTSRPARELKFGTDTH